MIEASMITRTEENAIVSRIKYVCIRIFYLQANFYKRSYYQHFKYCTLSNVLCFNNYSMRTNKLTCVFQCVVSGFLRYFKVLVQELDVKMDKGWLLQLVDLFGSENQALDVSLVSFFRVLMDFVRCKFFFSSYILN
jgi:hypothetical protein